MAQCQLCVTAIPTSQKLIVNCFVFYLILNILFWKCDNIDEAGDILNNDQSNGCKKNVLFCKLNSNVEIVVYRSRINFGYRSVCFRTNRKSDLIVFEENKQWKWFKLI